MGSIPITRSTNIAAQGCALCGTTDWAVHDVDRGDVPELHNITLIESLESIVEHGILSPNRARELIHRSVANVEVSCPAARDRVEELETGIAVTLNPNLFFR